MLRLVIALLSGLASFYLARWQRSKAGGEACPVSTAGPPQVVMDFNPDCARLLAALNNSTPTLEAAKIDPLRSSLYLHKNDVSKIKENSVLKSVFSQLHHPETPVKAEMILSQALAADFEKFVVPATDEHVQSKVIPLPKEQPFARCSSLYLTRSGSRESMPNKCVAVARVPAEQASPTYHSHRYGTQAKMTDAYSLDFATSKEYTDERALLPLVLGHLDRVVYDFSEVMGPALDSNGQTRTMLVMVANEGVMDLLLNFICSCQANGVSIANLVVFLGQPEFAPLINGMGAKSFFSPYLGSIPRKAADGYGDATFARLMWLKATSVYVAAKAGFHVLFQDADLVWLRDPVPYLQTHVSDIAFMDDGARTTRFTPFFVNSGFYYQKHNNKTQFLMEKMLKSAVEISSTHSHQATLTRHLTELHAAFGLDMNVLPELLFPSGAQWHNNKPFIKRYLSPSPSSSPPHFLSLLLSLLLTDHLLPSHPQGSLLTSC